MTIDEFREMIEAFLERSNFAPSSLGRLVMSDPRFVGDLLKRRRDVRTQTIEKFKNFIDQWDAENARATTTETRPE